LAGCLDPKYATAYRNRGVTYENKGEHDKAIADFNEAIRLDPKVADSYYGRGVAHGKKGDRAKAEEDFEQAKKLGFKPQ
jgi:tetratricopeptide (TPR) repeat protein